MSVINSNRGSKSVPDNINYLPKQARPAIDVKAMNTLVFNLGVKCRIYTTVPCPNVKSIDGAEHELSCPLCKGKQLYDSDSYVESIVGFLGQDRNQEFNQQNIGSLYEEGSASATFIAGINLTYYTKIELPDFSKPFYQLVQRQQGAVDILRYRAKDTVTLLVDKNGKIYQQDTDFEINADGWIKWLPTSSGAKRPTKGTIYSIHYHAIVTLRAMSAMHAGRWSADSNKRDYTENVEYSEQWKLQLDYLVVHEDGTGKKLEVNQIFAPGE